MSQSDAGRRRGRWEYVSLTIGFADNPDDVLKAWGQEAWELVAVAPCIPCVGSDWKHRYIFKRPARTALTGEKP